MRKIYSDISVRQACMDDPPYRDNSLQLKNIWPTHAGANPNNKKEIAIAECVGVPFQCQSINVCCRELCNSNRIVECCLF